MGTEPLLVLALVIGASAAIYFYARPEKRVVNVASLRKELAHLTHDQSAADRLIEAERRKDPDATELELLRKVVNRLKHERRR
jgi:hypothetical protein